MTARPMALVVRLCLTTALVLSGATILLQVTGTAPAAAADVAPTVTTQPLSQYYTSGQSLTFTAGASGSPVPTVQWQYSYDGGITWTNVSGATSTSLTVGPLNGLVKFWEVRAVFTNSVGSTSSNSATMVFMPAPRGYWLVGSDGGVFTFGQAQFQGSTGSLRLQRPVVGVTPTPNKSGYWLVASDGGVFAFDAPFVGSIPGLGLHPASSGLPNSLNKPIVGVVSSTSGQGYYMVASDGGVFAFNSTFVGSCPGIGGCSGAAVAVAPDAVGNGYWLVTATGHVYAFGDAPYFGAPGPQSSAITSMVRTPDGGGYWVLDANGQVFAYGDAAYFGGPVGSTGGFNPATAIFAASDGEGYWVASAAGSVFHYGDAPNDGSMAGTHLNGYIIAGTGF